MKVGILLSTRALVAFKPASIRDEVMTFAERAEEVGFHSLWVGDSVLAKPRLDALTTLSYCASITYRLRLGTMVLLPALRHPILLAQAWATLDQLARGRTLVGVGIGAGGAVKREFSTLGIRPSERIARMEETVEILRRLWSDGVVSYQGRYYKLDGVELEPKPSQRPHPPILISAGRVDEALKRVARLGDGWIAGGVNKETRVIHPRHFAECYWKIAQHAIAMKRSLEGFLKVMYLTTCIDEDPLRAAEEARTFLQDYYGARYEAESMKDRGIFGPSEELLGALEGFRAAGADLVVLRIASRDQKGQLELISREVLPSL